MSFRSSDSNLTRRTSTRRRNANRAVEARAHRHAARLRSASVRAALAVAFARCSRVPREGNQVSTVTLDGANPGVATTTGPAPTAAGAVTWQAVYNGGSDSTSQSPVIDQTAVAAG